MLKSYKRHFLLLVALLCLVILIALSTGYDNTSISDILRLFGGKGSQSTLFIMTSIRLPRILACMLGGASLALSGMLLQTLTKNALSDSGILGINTGAGFMIALVVGFFDITDSHTIRFLPFFAMCGGIITIVVVYFMSRQKNHSINPTRLIITGVGVSTMLSGLMISIISHIRADKMDYIVSWLSGKVTGGNWEYLALLTPLLLLLWGITHSRSRFLNIMALNEQTALALGLDLKKERLITLILATSLASLSVVLVGNITFIGLVAGHITRKLLGSDHRITLPASMLIGMMILLIADTLGRSLLVGTGIPTGLVVSIIGAPYFLWLMTKVN
ncbi:FecCD family ABC transporter permease [Streptococcus sp. zg-JUN1979]|uniref:FecCD family ABC transporter permease n=1 Tax=Streptococcus sp. zg-JUN1979 TaxID=3391450 RepID=UPI0039A4DE7A